MDAPGVRGELLVVELAERVLETEVGQVQILLVDDRRDPWVDLDHRVADELDVEEVIELELGGDRGGDVDQLGVVECLEVHRQPGAHLLARLGMAEHDPAFPGDPVDRPLAAAGELHDERLGLVVAEELDQLLQAQRLRDAGAVLEELPTAVGGGRKDTKAPRPGGDQRLEGDILGRVAELVRGPAEALGAADASPRGAANANRVQ